MVCNWELMAFKSGVRSCPGGGGGGGGGKLGGGGGGGGGGAPEMSRMKSCATHPSTPEVKFTLHHVYAPD